MSSRQRCPWPASAPIVDNLRYEGRHPRPVTECRMSNGPVVVIPAPIDVMDWNYDVERSILEPLGIELVVPASPEEAAARMPDADVIFTSSPLAADDIATLRNCVGIVCYSVGMDYVDAKAAAAQGIPVWNCPTSNNEEVSDHAVLLILAAQRRLLRFATAAREGDWDVYQWPRARADPPSRDAHGGDRRSRSDRSPRGAQDARFPAQGHRARSVHLEHARSRGRAGVARRAVRSARTSWCRAPR